MVKLALSQILLTLHPTRSGPWDERNKYRTGNIFPFCCWWLLQHGIHELRLNIGSTAVLTAPLQSSYQERMSVCDILWSAAHPGCLVPPSLSSLLWRSLGLRFSGPFLLVGRYEVFRRLKKKDFLLSVVYRGLPVPNYTFTGWMNGNRE